MATTSSGTNFRGGSSNSGGSHLVGWDSGNVRAERYSFKTGSWPVTAISFTCPVSGVYQGDNIAVRYGISTSSTAYVNSSGSSTGYLANKGAKTSRSISLKANTTYYITFFPGVSRSSYGLIKTNDGKAFTITLTELIYTECTAPTTVTLDKEIEVPGQSAVLSWSGAVAGTSLTIGSYDVYYSDSEDGEYTLLGNTTDSFYTVTAPTAGQYYYYKVKAITAEDQHTYDSPLSEVFATLKGNTAPTAPTVNPSRTVIPSYGTSVDFTVTPGTDIDGQTLTLAYSTTSTGEKISFTSPLTVNLTAAATYYFYTYDGLEYSAATSQAITKNTKPTISVNGTTTVIGTYSALGGTGTTGSQLGYASNIAPAISTSSTGKVMVELEYYSSDNTTAWDSSSASRTTVQEITTSSTSIVLNNYNVHQYIGLGKDKILGANNVHWRLRLKVNDGIEDSDFIYYPASNQYYSIARASSLVNKYNQFANSNISGTNAGEIWKLIRLEVYNDTSVPTTSVIATVNGSTVNATVQTSVSNSKRYIDITLPENLASEVTINITAQMKDSNSTIVKTVTTTAKETKIPTLEGQELTHGAQTIKPFTDSGTFAISTTWPFGSYTTIDSTTLAAYNCSTTASNAIKLIHSSSSNGSGANRVIKTLTWSKSSDNITASMNRNAAYDWEHSLGITNYTGTVVYYCRLEITNLFGKVISTEWKSLTFDFKETAQSPTITSIDYSLDGSTWSSLGNKSVQEGVYLRLNCSFGLYTTDEVKVSVLLKNNSGERSVNCYEFGSPSKITPITYSSLELNRATGRTVASNTKSYVYYVNTEIADTTVRQWRIKIDNSGGSVTSGYKDTPVVRQCAPTLALTQCTTNAQYQLTYAFTVTDAGGGTLSNYLHDGTQNITGKLNSSSGTVQATVTGWETKTISVRTDSVVTGLYTHTKTYYSNAIIVYQISPTIAYRKNQIGVNTDSPTSNAIVDIHQSTGKQVILIQGVDANNKINKFEINPITGEIKFYFDGTLQNTANLKQGYLT